MKNLRNLLFLIFFSLIIFTAAFIYMKFYHISNLEPFTAGDWKIEQYHKNGSVNRTNFPLKISSDSVGGVAFVADTPQSDQKILIIRGETLEGNPKLRLRYDDGKPQYSYGPGNEFKLWVRPHQKFEIDIYSDNPFSYRVDEISLKDCPKCLSMEEFKALVLDEVPGLAEAVAKKDHLQAAALLLPWAARVSDLGSQIPNTAPYIYNSIMPPNQVYSEVWEKDESGGMCGAFAAFYTTLLQEFGINSFVIGIGFDYSLSITHATSIVAIPDNSGWKFYIFDPTCAGTFMKNGAFIDLGSIISGYDRKTYTLDHNYWVYEKAIPRDYIQHQNGVKTNVQKAKDYRIDDLISSWGRVAQKANSPWALRFEAYQSDARANMMIDMMLANVYYTKHCKTGDECKAFETLFQNNTMQFN